LCAFSLLSTFLLSLLYSVCARVSHLTLLVSSLLLSLSLSLSLSFPRLITPVQSVEWRLFAAAAGEQSAR
jgi:hypothetical protein